MKKTKKDLTKYAYAKVCGVHWSTIHNRVKVGKLVLNSLGEVPEGTEIVKKLKLGRPCDAD